MDRIGSLNSQVSEEKIFAICQLKGESGVNGIVKLVSQGESTLIRARFTGLSSGLHGFHIHQYGNLTEGCKTAGAHFNPKGKTHGGPEDAERHAGDLGNVVAVDNEPAVFELSDRSVKLSGVDSVIGRSFVIHADPDDLGRGGFEDSKTTGHAGARLACGVIGLSAPFDF